MRNFASVVDGWKKATSKQGCRLAAFLLLHLQCPVMLMELCACAQCSGVGGGGQGTKEQRPQSLHGGSSSQLGLRSWLALEAPGFLGRAEAERAAQLFPPSSLMLTSSFCHLKAIYCLLHPYHPLALPGSETRWGQLKCYSNLQHLYKSLSKKPV